MTGSIKIHTALAFEDPRFELTGKVSLMGVFTDGKIEVEEFPTRQKVIFLLVFDALTIGDIRLRGRVEVNGEKKTEFEVELALEEVATGVLVPLFGTNASFDEPGELTLSLAVGRGAKYRAVKTWPVTRFLPPEDAAS